MDDNDNPEFWAIVNETWSIIHRLEKQIAKLEQEQKITKRRLQR